MSRWHALLWEEEGVTAVEYGMIIGSIALASYLVIRVLGVRISQALIEYLAYEYLW